MYALAHFFTAVDLCNKSGSVADVSATWDKGVASIVGSIEGSSEGGAVKSDGMLLYNLANKRCDQFNTCDANGKANIVPKIMEQFNGGLASAQSSDCAAMDAAANKIAHLTLIPVMQGVMRYGIKNESKGADSGHKDIAEGEIFSKSVLPVMAHYNSAAADVIEANMLMKTGVKPVADGSQYVASALGSVAPDFGVTCDELGSAEESDPCVGANLGASGSERASAVAGIISMLTLTIVSLIVV